MKLKETLQCIDGLSLEAVKHIPHPVDLAALSEKVFYEIDVERGCFRLSPAGRAVLVQEGET